MQNNLCQFIEGYSQAERYGMSGHHSYSYSVMSSRVVRHECPPELQLVSVMSQPMATPVTVVVSVISQMMATRVTVQSVSCHNQWPPQLQFSQCHVTTDGHPSYSYSQCHVTTDGHPSYSYSQCHVTTDGQVGSSSVCWAPLRGYDQRSTVLYEDRATVHSVTISRKGRWPPYLPTQQPQLNARNTDCIITVCRHSYDSAEISQW